MTSKELLAYCRTRLDDAVGESSVKLFPDSELCGYISECQEQVASESLVIRDAYNGTDSNTLCELVLSAGSSLVKRSELILRVDDILYSRGNVLRRLRRKENVNEYPLAITAGDPTGFWMHIPGYIAFDKAPEANAILKLRIRRMPITVVSPSGQLEIPELYRRRLVNGVLGFAFLKPDTETYNEKKSASYFALFREDKEWIKRMDLRLHGNGARV